MSQLLERYVAVPLFTQQKRLLVANIIEGLVFDPFGPVLDVTYATKADRRLSLLGATATTAASGGNREELLGQWPAGCERQRSKRWEPQSGQCHRR